MEEVMTGLFQIRVILTIKGEMSWGPREEPVKKLEEWHYPGSYGISSGQM